MKKIIVCAFALSLVVGMAVTAGFAAPAARTALAQAAAAPLKTIQGTVKADGDKASFVADEGGKSWAVMNPETLKGHDGHHVEVSAHIYADKDAIHVMSVKMAKKGDM